MTGRAKILLLRYRPLMVILLLTLAIWTAWAMSENQTYSSRIKVEVVGIDTARFAVLSQDHDIQLDIVSNGYAALTSYLDAGRHSVRVDFSSVPFRGDRFSIPTRTLMSEIRSQLGIKNNIQVSTSTDSIRVFASLRLCRGYVPKLRDVSFEFADGYGLMGSPSMLTDTVWLYGSERSLNHIDELFTLPSAVANIGRTDTFQLDLSPVWRRYPDLRVSTPSVSIAVPVGAFSEREVEVPVSVEDAGGARVRLYPDKVRVSVLVPATQTTPCSPDQFACGISIHEGADRSEVRIKSFPSQVRIKKIEPSTVQYVLIK